MHAQPDHISGYLYGKADRAWHWRRPGVEHDDHLHTPMELVREGVGKTGGGRRPGGTIRREQYRSAVERMALHAFAAHGSLLINWSCARDLTRSRSDKIEHAA